ncbi:hypothetical protein CVV65_05660 [Kyrpidia spormannii]|uniref:Uncharacterized protein n=1 Tax=Kyrpidia spormannii TaxID=2055160 RepID=A0A2K8N590_9BACL|nr:hypothetical protein [Kyrpidia spormannii]ATY84504.1 hypothetical protein CVV65_05660 [Kyrpidia spormannii]
MSSDRDYRRLMYTYWGSYLEEPYKDVGIAVAQTLMKHWGTVKLLSNSTVPNLLAKTEEEKDYLEDIETPEALEQIVKGHRLVKDSLMFAADFVNSAVTVGKYWVSLIISFAYMRLIEYDRLKFYRTKDPAVNAARTEALLAVCKDVARLPAIRELWMGDSWNAFLGEPAFLYRPNKLYYRVQNTSQTLQTKEKVLRLAARFEELVPRGWVLDYLRKRLGPEAVEELDNKKIVVRFYDRSLTKPKVRGWGFLKEFERDVNAYVAGRGVKL